jgi:hypothetical protein
MKELYLDRVEYVPTNDPKPCGRPVQISCFVDSDYANDKITHRSRSGVLIFVNKAPIVWHSKQHNTVETSRYGAKFVAMRQ